MTDSNEKHSLEVVNVDNALTTEELQALKRLASAYRFTRGVLIVVMAIITLFGVDRVFDWFHQHVR